MKTKRIIRFEWLLLSRSSLMLSLLTLLTISAAYALYYGVSKINHQMKVIAYIDRQNDSTRQQFEGYFLNEKIADSVRFGWAGMNSLYDGFTTEEYLEHNMAVNRPNALSHLSVGQRDVYPYYRKVTARSLYNEGGGPVLDEKYGEIHNPQTLATGNFDVTFLILYLLPLFIIALCYNVYAYEKEAGTYPLLRTQQVSIRRIVIIKILLRYMLFAVTIIVVVLIGWGLTPTGVERSLIASAIYCVLALLYQTFWFGLCWLIVSLKKSSSFNALALVACWVTFLILIPSFISSYVSSHHKVDSRMALITEISEKSSGLWDFPDTISLRMYYEDYPDFAVNPIKPLWTSNDSFDSLGKNEDIDARYNKKIILWHYYLDKLIAPKVDAYNQQLAKKLGAARKYAALSPPVYLQEVVNDLAASGSHYFLEYKRHVAAYRDSLFALTNNYVFAEKQLALSDYRAYPKFQSKAEIINVDLAPALTYLLSLIVFTLLVGWITFNRLPE